MLVLIVVVLTVVAFIRALNTARDTSISWEVCIFEIAYFAAMMYVLTSVYH